MDRKMQALREDGAAAPAKSHKVGLRARLLRRMKGWCSYGRSDAAPGLHEEDEEEQEEQEETGYVERPAAPRPVRIRTRDLFNWRREFEMAVGDVLRVAVCGGDAKAKAKAKRKMVLKLQNGFNGIIRRSKSVCNIFDTKKSLARSASDSDLKPSRETKIMRFLRDLMMSRATLKRTVSGPNMNAFSPDAKTCDKSVSFPNICF